MRSEILQDFDPDEEVTCVFCQKTQLATNHKCAVCGKTLPRGGPKLKTRTPEKLLPVAVGWTLGLVAATVFLPAGMVLLSYQHGATSWTPIFYWAGYWALGFVLDLFSGGSSYNTGNTKMDGDVLESAGTNMRHNTSFVKMDLLVWPARKVRTSWVEFIRSLKD